VIYLFSKEEELWFLRMYFLSVIMYGLTPMAIVATTQHQERKNNGNVDRLNLRRLVGSLYNGNEGENDEDSDGEGNDNDGKNEVLIKVQCVRKGNKSSI
jgi:hypothetical protein